MAAAVRRHQQAAKTSLLHLLTFDATNTFLHFSRPVYEQYAQVARRYDILVENPQQLQTHFEQSYAKHWKLKPNFGYCGTKQQQQPQKSFSSHRWWTDVVRDTFISAGYVKKQQEEDDVKRLEILSAHLYRHFCMAEAWRIAPEFAAVIDTLRRQRPALRIGVISNFDERLETILRAVGCLHLFDFVLTSVAAGAPKPSAEIFNFALKKEMPAGVKTTTLVNAAAKSALHVGNDLKRDYYGAINAGWNALLYDPTRSCAAVSAAGKPETAVDQSRRKHDIALANEVDVNKIEELPDLITYLKKHYQ